MTNAHLLSTGDPTPAADGDGPLHVRTFERQDVAPSEYLALQLLDLARADDLVTATWGPHVLEGDSGRMWLATVQHQRTQWGCLSSEVRLVRPAGVHGGHLHVAIRECSQHEPGGEGNSFAGDVARAIGVTTSGVNPFRVGHTSIATVDGLVAKLRDPARAAPVVLLSGSPADARAGELVSRLHGGALVATIDGDASWQLSAQLGSAMGCYAGAVRVYGSPRGGPDLANNPIWVSRRVAQRGWSAVAEEIVATVGALSRGPRRPPLQLTLEREATSRALREATAVIDQLRADLAGRPEATGAATDAEIDSIFDAQNQTIAQLESDLEAVQAQVQGLEDRLSSSEATRESLLLALTHQTWRDEENQTQSPVVAVVDPSVDAAIERLGDPTGALVCTENALRSWREARYPDPDRMLDVLRRLEMAADEWRGADTQIGERLGEWLTKLTGLRYAGSDLELERRGLASFHFDGRSWSRIPHIKIDDAKHSNRVGRIYSAIDAEGKRWILDHVGQKLYGR